MRNRTALRLASAALLLAGLAPPVAANAAEPQHAIAMRGDPALPAGFDHFPYVNPDAPQGGTMRYGVFGTFDNLNPVIVRGALTTARGLWFDKQFGNLVFEPLMQRSADEPFTMYGLLAETVETDADRTYVEFQLNPEATFSDGEPVTPQDVIFTVEMLREHGRPLYGNWLRPVTDIETVGEHGVRFVFDDTADRETPMLIAGLPVLPEHAFDRETFGQTTLDPVVGSGPYVIDEVVPGRRIVYEKDPDYWGADLAVRQGVDNYERVRIDYYRDSNAQFEAFKKGLSYVYIEGDPAHWNTAYDFPAVTDGDVVKESFEAGGPADMLGFVFNTRRPLFADRTVRKALSQLFDFQWANQNLFYGAYDRTAGFFQNSRLSSLGRPASEKEKALLEPYPDAVQPEVMDGTYAPPTTDGSGSDRSVLQSALNTLRSAGYRFEGRRLVGPGGDQLAFEILVASPEQERIALAYKRTLGRVGIEATVRQVDDAQYQARKSAFAFDMIIQTYSSSLSPGAEQVYRWGSGSRNANGSFNYAGVDNPAIDALIEEIVTTRSEADFVAATRAYDRALISGHYVLPLFHLSQDWLARWSFIEHPETTPLYGYQLPTFWRDPASVEE